MSWILIIGLLFVLLIINQLLGEKDLLKLSVFSIIGYFMLFAVVADIMILLEKFSLIRTVIVTSAITICTYGIGRVIVKDVSELQIRFNKSNTIIIPFMVLGLILTHNAFDFYGMGQDEGVYQTEAINFYYDRNDWSHPIEEVDNLTDSEYKQFEMNNLWWWLGFDAFYDMSEMFVPGFDYDEAYTVNGMWHGIPAFPAILGVSAKVFGLAHMQCINCIFFICLIVIAGVTLKKIGVDRILSGILMLLLTVCPIMVWVARSALSETFFACIIATYMYCILDERKQIQYLSIIPVVTLMFYHISAYILVPMFLLVFWYKYSKTNDSVFFKLSIGAPICYVCSYFLVVYIQPIYVNKNISSPLKIAGIRTPILVCGACILAIIISLLLKRSHYRNKNIDRDIQKILPVICFMGLLYEAYRTIQNNFGFQEIRMMTIIVYCVMTGLIIVPTIIGIIILKKYELSEENRI